MKRPEVFERSFDLDDPELDRKVGAFSDEAWTHIQAQGAPRMVALKKVEGRTLVCLVIPAGTPEAESAVEELEKQGFSRGDQLAVKHRPAPASSTGDLLRKVQEAQRRAAQSGESTES